MIIKKIILIASIFALPFARTTAKEIPTPQPKFLNSTSKPVKKLVSKKSSRFVPDPTPTVDQLKQIDEAKKTFLADTKNEDIIETKIKKLKFGQWISIAVSKGLDGSFIRYEIFKKDSEKPVLFYEDERGIDIISGSQGRLLFINDFFVSSGGVSVMVADLKTGKNWRIDESAIKDCSSKLKGRKSGNGKIMNGKRPFTALAISPDDKKVLLRSDDDQLERDDKFEPLYYVVDAISGKILETHRVKNPW